MHNQTVVVGEKATLECHVEGDNPIRVTWLRNEKSLQTDDNVFKVKDLYKFFIKCGKMGSWKIPTLKSDRL